jgi:transposase
LRIVKFEFDELKALSLYQRGMNDTEVANQLDVPWQTICKWRRRLGLPSNYQSKGRPRNYTTKVESNLMSV